MALHNLTQPEYQPQPTDPSGSLQGLYKMVYSFLGLVQPNSFPAGKRKSSQQEALFRITFKDYSDLAYSSVGWLACLLH